MGAFVLSLTVLSLAAIVPGADADACLAEVQGFCSGPPAPYAGCGDDNVDVALGGQAADSCDTVDITAGGTEADGGDYVDVTVLAMETGPDSDLLDVTVASYERDDSSDAFDITVLGSEGSDDGDAFDVAILAGEYCDDGDTFEVEVFADSCGPSWAEGDTYPILVLP